MSVETESKTDEIFLCAVCGEEVRADHSAIQCSIPADESEKEGHWTHILCLQKSYLLNGTEIPFTDQLYAKLQNVDFEYKCPKCIGDSAPLPLQLLQQNLLSVQDLRNLGAWSSEVESFLLEKGYLPKPKILSTVVENQNPPEGVWSQASSSAFEFPSLIPPIGTSVSGFTPIVGDSNVNRNAMLGDNPSIPVTSVDPSIWNAGFGSFTAGGTYSTPSIGPISSTSLFGTAMTPPRNPIVVTPGQTMSQTNAESSGYMAVVQGMMSLMHQQQQQILQQQQTQQKLQQELFSKQMDALVSTIKAERESSDTKLADEHKRWRETFEKTASSSSQVQRDSVESSFPKLPEMKLQKFDGNVLEWPSFWETYWELCGRHSKYSDIQKMHFLLSGLEGEAKRAVENYKIEGASYPSVVATLKDRYDDKDKICSAHHQALMTLPSVQKMEIKQLQAFADKVDSHARALISLNNDDVELVDIQCSTIIPCLFEKLPMTFRSYLFENGGRPAKTKLSKFREGLTERLRIQTEIQGSSWIGKNDAGNSFHGKSQNQNKGSTNDRGRLITTGAGLVAADHNRPSTGDEGCLRHGNGGKAKGSQKKPESPNSPSVQQKGNVYCHFCEEAGKHRSVDCLVYPTIASRKEKLGKVCYICLKKGHFSPKCLTKGKFTCRFCQSEIHHSALCPDIGKTRVRGSTASGREPSKPPQAENKYVYKGESTCSGELQKLSVDTIVEEAYQLAENEFSTTCSGMEDIAMQTVVTTVRNPETGSEMVVSILLDSGGKRTYISQRVANTLRLSAKSFRNLGVCIFSANESKTIKTGVTDFQVLSANGQFISLIGNTVGKITAPVLLGHIPLSDEDKKLVKGLKMADPYFNKTREFQVDVLIGNDFYAMLLGKGQQKLKSSGVTLLETRLGWVTAGFISGGLTHPSGDDLGNLALLQSELKPIVLEEESFSPNLEDLWKFETIGIKDPKQPSEEDDLAVKQFWDTVKFEDGRVSVKWLKKPDCPTLPTNFPVALCRLRSLLKNLSKNPEYSEKYSKNFQDQLEKGVIEKVTSEMNKGFPTHYIPHHAILTPQKTTTKMRVVFDASARQNRQCPSLNECLMRGPNLLPDLCGLLMRMRLKKVILIANIEKAFLQVSLQEPDRDLTRFLWLKNPFHLTLENNLQIYRFCRVPFGFKTSPFLLAGAVMFLLESAQESEKVIADQICNDLYVDNLITGCDDIESALVIYNTAKKLFRAGNMNLREWTSNSAEFCQKVSESDRIKDENVKVLGLNWNTSEDVVSISVKSFDSFVEAKTKRQMLGCIASIFDPLNLLGCLKVRGMIFLQKMWKLKLDWDDEVPVVLLNEWKSLIGCFKSIQEITFPRCPFVGNEDSVLDLLCFADASKEAYTAVIYLRSETGNKFGKVSLIFSKTRLVPVSGMTIPRAELMAVLIATRCLNYVTTQLKLNIRHFYLWSDSQVVLGWIRNEARDQGVFVTNRILEILKFKNITYQYVPSEQNPADLATKTRDLSYQIPWDFWINGPEWLKSPCQDWPKFENRSEKATKKTVEVILLGGGPQSKTCGKIETNLEVLIEVQKHSSFSALVRVTAWVKRFIQILKNKVEQSKSTNVHPMRTRAKGKVYGKIKDVAPLSQEDIRNAQRLWIAEVQRKEFPDLFTEKIVRSTFAQNLGIKVGDDNILRCHGRLGESSLSSEAKYPMLLPPNSELTILIIRTFHKYAFHAGVNHTLTKVRSMFWIPKGRKVISKVVKSCSVCKRISAKPFAHPVMPNLPAERVTEAVPFSHTGVDYFGPLYCREPSNPKKEMKVWVVLFTCLSIRAVHLELVTDMSAETFLRALRRFVARRGKPKVILSDNALQFKLTKQVMSLGEKLSLSQQVKNHLYQDGIIWKFIPALTPWAGGVYERMVGITKMALKKALGRSCLSEDQLRTILVEVEEVVNSRPITFVSMTDNDSDLEILTPQKFLSCGRNERLPIIPEGDPSDPEVIQRPSTHAKVMNSWKQAQYHLNRFWQIWRNDYLLNLRERHKSDKFPKRKSQVFRAPRLGELVLIKSENQPRGMWKLGRVVKLHEGRDSLIRSAEVRVTGSKENITRPVSLLYPLEIQSENEPDSSEFGQLASEFLISFESFEDEVFPRVSGRLYSGFARVSGSPYPDCRAVKPSPCISETNCLILENCLAQREFDADSISSYVEPLTDEELEEEKTPKLRDLRERINERRAKSLSQKGKRGTQAPLRSLEKEKKGPSKNPPNPKPQKKPEVKSPQKVIPNQGTKPGMGGNHPKPSGQNQKQSWKCYKSPVTGMNFRKIKCERCGKMRPQKYEHCYCKMRVQWRKNRKQNQVRHNQRDHSRQPPVMNSIPPASNFNGDLPPPPPFVPPVAPFASSFPTAMPWSPFPFAPPSNQLPFLPPGNVASVEFHPNGSIAKCVYK